MKQLELSQFKAVIFDMDGVLIDSEPLWKIAMEKVFTSINCPLSKKDFEKTVGLRLDEVIAYWYKLLQWKELSPEQVLDKIVQEMVILIQENGEPLPGVISCLNHFKNKGLKIGLATSSYEILIETVLKTLNISSFFDKTHSAEHERFGKPHPDVYIHTAHALNVDTHECLVIEDSLTGVIAGKAAKMTVICVPEKSHEPNPKLQLADYIYDSLADFHQELNTNESIKTTN